MNHLVRPHFGSFRKSSLPWRYSFLRFPKTVPSPDPVHDSLKRRIERAPDSMPSLTPLLHEWRQLGNKPGLSELRSIISSLHKFDRFPHALQVLEWMSDQQVYNLSTVDYETRLLLIAKLRGLEEASSFLDTIPLKKRDFYVHNALLNSCKTHGGGSSLSIAETTFQKMRDLGLASTNPKPYNTMLSLYYYTAQNHDMVVKLLLEMDDLRFEPQGVPFNKLFSCFALASGVKDPVGMEKFLDKWGHRMEPWATCFFPACLYMGLGSVDKSMSLFRKTEDLLDDDCRKNMYGALMRAYCQQGDREDVYRLSNLAKRHGVSFDNTVSSEMIKFFAMKNDLDGAQEIMEEWDTGAGDLGLSDFGHRNRCMKEEADKAINMLGKKWESKWESLTDRLQRNLAEGEDEDGERERRKRVAEALEGRLHERWNPKTSMTLSAYACVQYVEGRRDMESAAQILKLLNKQEQVSRAMDKDRLCLKMVEAMRGGGYVGGQD